MNTQKSLFITLCRIHSLSLDDNIKLRVIIKIKDEQQTISNAYPIKNGVANFYRQSFQLPVLEEGFQFLILNTSDNQKFCQIHVDHAFISQINNYKNTYECISSQLKIVWQGCIKSEQSQEQSQNTDRILFDTTQFQKGKNTSIEDLHPSKKIREKRKKSFKIKPNQDAISEPSDLAQNTLELTNDTLQLKKMTSLLQKVPPRNNLHTQRIHYKINQTKVNSSSRKKIIKDSISMKHNINVLSSIKQPSINLQTKLKNTQLSQKSRPERLLNSFTKISIKKEQNNVLKRSKSGGFLSKISLRDILSTAVVGIISGITAAQF